MSTMPLHEFMQRFGPSNEGTAEVTGTWMEELADQITDREACSILSCLVSEFRRGVPQEEPVLVDFNPDRVHDGHTRVLALYITGAVDITYGVQI